MSIAPHTGIVDFGTFTAPTASTDGIQGEVPQPLAGQEGYVLTGTGWASAGSVGLVGYQGTWNALTNTPTLTSSVGTQGYYYVVNVAGTTNLNGITDWQVGDWAIFNGSVWQKVDNTDSYDPANVAITGGTINNTTIGATTPSTGVFTTLTAQNETLKGTGQNLVTQSQTFTNASWAGSTVTRADNQTTAPDGSGTGGTITSTNQSYGGLLRTYCPVTSTTYTLSAYVKKNNWSYVGLRVANIVGSGDRCAFFNFDTLATSTVGISGATFTATSVGNGWYRIVLTGVNNTTGTFVTDVAIVASDGSSATNTGAGNIVYVWGAQLEIGSTANTYIPTTTTAVYGTPTLSFSGVASIGLQSDGSLYHQPAGTGAVQAQATTSSATGGNARGANAVDWQTLRSVNSMVASATASVIVGGQNNTASAYTSFVGAGANSYAQGSNSFVGAGNGNVVSSGGAYGAIVAGNSNTVSSANSLIGGGVSNTAGGYYNFIGGGFTNVGTSASAVTTQSGTMNATTAVTLSGSNASIKVGQIISGTSIASDTYVAAISGTSLTLSKVASGSSTNNLSFFTPHGVVVGGGNNQATGSYSFIGGGGDAGTAANRNVASGDWSVVGGGFKNVGSGVLSAVLSGTNNTASGISSVVCGGGTYGSITNLAGNVASGLSSFVGAGFGNIASSNASFVGAGKSNVSNGLYSFVSGGTDGTARAIWGNHVIPALNPFSGVGTSQSATLVLGKQTADATATVLTVDSGSASTVNQVTLPNNSAYYFKGSVIANVTGAANGAAWSIEGAIMRGANAASTVLMGTPAINRVAATAGASAWAISITADTTNGGLAVTVTGAASTTIRWVCKAETTEVTF